MSQKIKTFLISLSLLLTGIALYSPSLSMAAINPANCASGRVDQQDPNKCAPLGNSCTGNSAQKCLDKNPFIKNLNQIVNFLAAAVGVVVIAVIILGGIQYTMAGDNPSAVGEARKRITNGLIALVSFIFMYTFLQWLIPGGVFK